MAIIAKPEITARMVAKYFIWLSNESGSFISNLKLQKVLYYAQGWHLALKGKPLFDDEFQAWIHGPAIPHIYGEYKKFGYQPISGGTKPTFAPAVEKFLKEVADVFLPLDAYQLELATHKEPPWQIARQDLPLDAACKNVITVSSMKEYFSTLLKK